MTKNEVVRLMENIKTFYHNFSFPPDLVEAWYERLKDIPFDVAKKNLDGYIAEDEIGRMPTIAKIMRVSSGGNVYEAKFYNKYDGSWHNYRDEMKLSYFDKDTYIDQNGYLWGFPQAD